MGGIEANLVSRGKKPVRCVCPWSDENTNHVDRRRSCISEMVYNVERKRADHATRNVALFWFCVSWSARAGREFDFSSARHGRRFLALSHQNVDLDQM